MSHLEIVAASESDALQMQKLSAMLAASGGSASLAGPGDQQLTLPASLYRALKNLVDDLSQGKPVCLVREEEELTTQAAADFLNVSRPYFIKLIESGAIPYTKTGTHRRILLRDVHAYKKVRDAERRAILDRMVTEALEDGSYFATFEYEDQEETT